MPTMCGPGAMRYGGLENLSASVPACGNRTSTACTAGATGRRFSGALPCQMPSSARPPLPCGASRRPTVALADITNITSEPLPLPGQVHHDIPTYTADITNITSQPLPLPGQVYHGAADFLIATALSHAEPAAAAPVMPWCQGMTMEERLKATLAEPPSILSQVFCTESVDEYIVDISKKLFRDEEKSLPQSDYMDAQPEISSNMRRILIDWLVEVHMKHHLCLETLHLTVNIIDRYLSKAPVTRRRLQLIGVVAMFIASKFEEIHAPEIDFWVYITASAYTQEDVVLMECSMLTTLNFQIMVPTAAHFLPLLQKANGCDAVHGALVEYIVELGLLDTRLLCYPPSHVVSAALLLSNELLGRKAIWPAAMAQLSRKTGPALRGCAEVLRELFELDRARIEGQPHAVHRKFSAAQRHEVATMAF